MNKNRKTNIMQYRFVILLLLLSTFASAQRRSNHRHLEVGFLFGLTNYSGDIAEKRIEFAETQPGYGAFLRYQITPKFSVKAHMYSGSISGDDKNSATRQERNFRFSTSITELGAVAEWHILGKSRFNSTGIRNVNLSPYLFFGLGATFASAEAEYYGPPDRRNEFLRVPFPEDGLKSRFLLAPMGIGFKADIFDRFSFGVDLGWRPVFSDDLDGVHYNGNPKKGDWYYFLGLTASFIVSGD
jgi:hypothetical protein